MNNKTKRIVYLIATGLLTALMLMSAGMYIFNHKMLVGIFSKLGYPSYIIYPLAAAKILGLVAIWSNKSRMFKEWAYAGFFFDFILAFFAHLAVNDGEYLPALVAMVLLFTSYLTQSKITIDRAV